MFGKYWPQMVQAVFSIPDDIILPEDLEAINQLKKLTSISDMEDYLDRNPYNARDRKSLKPYLFDVVKDMLACYREQLFQLPMRESWWINTLQTLDKVMCQSGIFYSDRGEVRLLSDVMQKLNKRSSRCDAAVTSKTAFSDDHRLQYALIEGASAMAGSKKIWTDSQKVIQSGRDALATIQRTFRLSSEALRHVAVPVFVYSGPEIRMSIVSSPGGQICWVQRFPVCTIPLDVRLFPSIIDVILLFCKAKWVVERTHAQVIDGAIDPTFNFLYSPRSSSELSKKKKK